MKKLRKYGLSRFSFLFILGFLQTPVSAFEVSQSSESYSLEEPESELNSASNLEDQTLSPQEVYEAIQSVGTDVARDLAKVIESVFSESGRPTAVIVGNEWQGSFIIGYRKGKGKVFFKGQTASTAPQIYWRAPSIGLNAGASASEVAILVYGAKQYEQLLQRFASIQGSYHLVIGAGVSYLRSTLDLNERNSMSLAYITVGVGFDAGVAVESLAFSKKERWLP